MAELTAIRGNHLSVVAAEKQDLEYIHKLGVGQIPATEKLWAC